MDKSIKIAVTAIIIIAFFTIFLFTSSLFVQNQSTRDGSVTVYFFYGEECPHCHNVMPFIINLTQKYPEVDIRILEVWHNESNQKIFEQLNQEVGVPNYGVPQVIIEKTVLVGDREIPSKMEGLIQESIKKKN